MAMVSLGAQRERINMNHFHADTPRTNDIAVQ